MKFLFGILSLSIFLNFYFYLNNQNLKNSLKEKDNSIFSMDEDYQDKISQLESRIKSNKAKNLKLKKTLESIPKEINKNQGVQLAASPDQEVETKKEKEVAPLTQEEEVEVESTFQEQQENWVLSGEVFFEQSLQLSSDDFKAYQNVVSEFQQVRDEIWESINSKQKEMFGDDQNVPFVLDYESERKLSDMKAKYVDQLRKRYGTEKVNQLIEHERQMKVKMIMENGYYNDFGLF